MRQLNPITFDRDFRTNPDPLKKSLDFRAKHPDPDEDVPAEIAAADPDPADKPADRKSAKPAKP